jgi:hypothetical protein
MKKLYIVDDGWPEDCAELVVAETPKQAEAICKHYGNLDCGNVFDVTEVTNWYCSDKKIPQIDIESHDWGLVTDCKANNKFRREVGFSCDGDARCDSCGLADLDGEFPVCPECNQCVECGHDDDCEEAKALKAEEGTNNVAV